MITREPHIPLLLFGGFESVVLANRTIVRPGVSPRTGVRGGQGDVAVGVPGGGRGETLVRESDTAVGVW